MIPVVNEGRLYKQLHMRTQLHPMKSDLRVQARDAEPFHGIHRP
jgi:hypothetical protein